ncbi:NAD(P)-binding protein [Annulohypoxylon maeteangense]|uniref:NAD(P)-binding protein n=1 Tax=Annulohypoxylon maeteangense TaxID=1927788 RepID=UPI002007365A|nr:NAD(P)-binding protein [Annulohypoxylon maeteangense]KAI0889189.1 NAD(P)-binding protein [Annulohypoxylon maeteangense]
MSTESTVKAFFNSPQFAVVGASTNPAKFGHKVFAWYHAHSLPVTPINPASPSIETPFGVHPTIKSLSELPDPEHTSLSVITPAPVTLNVLKEAKKLGIPAVWLQPGTWDESVIAFARGTADEGEESGYRGAVVAGDGGSGHGGWCVLVDGERGLRAAGKL